MKFINVFLGKTDFYPRIGRTMEWDICASVAIGESCGFNIKIYEESTTLENLDKTRNPIYKKTSDIEVDVSYLSKEDVISSIIDKLKTN